GAVAGEARAFCPSLLALGALGALAGLAPDQLTLIADALALVRLGFAHAADLRRDLTDGLLVRSVDADKEASGVRILAYFECYSGSGADLHPMAEAELHHQIRPGHRRPVAYAVDL